MEEWKDRGRFAFGNLNDIYAMFKIVCLHGLTWSRLVSAILEIDECLYGVW